MARKGVTASKEFEQKLGRLYFFGLGTGLEKTILGAVVHLVSGGAWKERKFEGSPWWAGMGPLGGFQKK